MAAPQHADPTVARILETQHLRDDIRAAADNGDRDEVLRLRRRIHDLELEAWAAAYTDCRHQRKQRRDYGGSNPTLDRLERELDAMLTNLGVPSIREFWSHRG